ncbi:MAG: hypothetical protein K6B70_05880, partial [Clostridia bacterium]|nr:hypothetical protein [Clostridia bacterium]
MSEEEKKAIEIVQGLKVYYDDECLLDEEELEENKTVNNAIDTLINLVEKQQKEIEHWKAGMKIVERDKNNHIERLEKELNNLKEIEKSHQEENGKLRVELVQEKEINKEIAFKNHKIKEESNSYGEEIIRLDNELKQEKEKYK